MRSFTALAVAVLASPAPGQLLFSEVMYDPASADERWEWLEVWNQGDAAIDLDGYLLDRLGDRERVFVSPNIVSEVVLETGPITNPTIIPAGGVAVLYNGEGLGYDPERFRAAWPGMPSQTPLIGVTGWSSNQLANRPQVNDYAPGNYALTLGLWPDEAAYRADAKDFGSAGEPDRRVYRIRNTAAAVGYDDSAPFRSVEGRASLHYRGGPAHLPGSWGVSNASWGTSGLSVETHLDTPVNGADFGSPGTPPFGRTAGEALRITEVMYNPISTSSPGGEWEWIEVYNPGPTIDFAATPHWLDDDDGATLEGPNLTTGSLGTGQTAVLFNPEAVTLARMQAAWDRPGDPPINWIAVEEWPSLANSGDLIAFWDSASDYAADHAGEDPLTDRAVTSLDYGAGDWPTAPNGDAVFLANLGSPLGDPSGWATSSGLFGDPDARQAAEVLEPGAVVDSAGGDHGSPGWVYPNTVSPLPGDYNRDGRVDAADYTVWRDGSPLPTETVSVGVTDRADLDVWRQGFGRGVGADAQAIPEPAAAWLVVAAGSLARGRRRFVAG